MIFQEGLISLGNWSITILGWTHRYGTIFWISIHIIHSRPIVTRRRKKERLGEEEGR